MLTKVGANKGRNWDILLGSLLFAYQLNYGPFLYSRNIIQLYGWDAKLPTALNNYSQELLLFTLNMILFFFQRIESSLRTC